MNRLESQSPTPINGGSLVPPRPNLGPEAWPEIEGRARWITPAISIVVLLLGLRIWNRWRRGTRSTVSTMIPDQANDLEPSNRQKMIAVSERIRESLLRAFGPGWQSKTTEEIGRATQLVQCLDSAEFDSLIVFLKLADRAKFADDELESIGDWELWATAMLTRLAAVPDSTNPRTIK